MLNLLKAVGAVVIGIMLGLLVTIRVLDRGGFRTVAGPWVGTPRDGVAEVDPYTLAANARSSVLPLGAAEGLTFLAKTDSDGAPFSPACDYAVTGPMPPARFWTLSLLDKAGFPVANPAERNGFTSADVLRDLGGATRIIVSANARPGNWLPTGRAESFVLMLTLYDTGLSTIGTTFDAAAMPRIAKRDCR